MCAVYFHSAKYRSTQKYYLEALLFVPIDSSILQPLFCGWELNLSKPNDSFRRSVLFYCIGKNLFFYFINVLLSFFICCICYKNAKTYLRSTWQMRMVYMHSCIIINFFLSYTIKNESYSIHCIPVNKSQM